MLDVDDLYPEHPKLIGLGSWCEVAGWLNLAAIAWCKRYLTDGVVPKAAVWRLASFRGMTIDGEAVTPEAVASRLVTRDMWHERGDGYLIHDFLDYQESRKTVLGRRRAWRERQRKHRESKAKAPKAVTPLVTRDTRVTHAAVTRDTGVTFASPSQKQEEKDPDARARARSKWDAARAQDDRTHPADAGDYVRHEPVRAAPRGGAPLRLGDVLARAFADSTRRPP
jgi:hypothetical protein